MLKIISDSCKFVAAIIVKLEQEAVMGLALLWILEILIGESERGM